MARKRGLRGRSSVAKDPVRGGWSAWVSLGTDPLTGKRLRKHVRGHTVAEVNTKIAELQNAYAVTNHEDPTVGEWLHYWLALNEQDNRKTSTLINRRWIVERRLVPQLGDIRLSEVQSEHIELALNRMTDLRPGREGQLVSQWTKNAALNVLTTALNIAVRRGRIPENPAAAVSAPPPQEREINPLTQEEITNIFAVVAERRNGVRWVFALLGLRQSEALALQWSDIDFDSQTLTIRRTLQKATWKHGCTDPVACGKSANCPRRFRSPRFGTPKTQSGQRTIPLSEQLITMLTEHYRQQQKERLLAAGEWRNGDWVFTTQLGAPLEHRNDLREWKAVLETAGVRDVRLHDARHTYATMLLLNGVDRRVVIDMLGWSRAAMTERYQHVVPQLRRDAAQRAEAYMWGRVDDASSR